MGSFDEAEMCFILHRLGEKYGKERISLYKDGGLTCFENTSGQKRKE